MAISPRSSKQGRWSRIPRTLLLTISVLVHYGCRRYSARDGLCGARVCIYNSFSGGHVSLPLVADRWSSVSSVVT